MVSLRSDKKISRLRNRPAMTTDFFLPPDFFLDVDTNDAASALTHLRLLHDISESPDYSHAMKYLKRVQASTDSTEYTCFLGVLREFQEDVLKEIDFKKDYVIKCALTLFQRHPDLLLGLGDYIPELLDTPDSPDHDPVKPLQETPAEASLHLQQVQARSQDEYNVFISAVQKRFLHSDHTTYMKICVTMHDWLVDASMPVRQAKADMAALLQRHDDLWKEFERFLPPALRAGTSSSR